MRGVWGNVIFLLLWFIGLQCEVRLTIFRLLCYYSKALTSPRKHRHKIWSARQEAFRKKRTWQPSETHEFNFNENVFRGLCIKLPFRRERGKLWQRGKCLIYLFSRGIFEGKHFPFQQNSLTIIKNLKRKDFPRDCITNHQQPSSSLNHVLEIVRKTSWASNVRLPCTLNNMWSYLYATFHLLSSSRGIA